MTRLNTSLTSVFFFSSHLFKVANQVVQALLTQKVCLFFSEISEQIFATSLKLQLENVK